VQALRTLMRLRLASERTLFGERPDAAYHRRRLDALEGRHPLVVDDRWDTAAVEVTGSAATPSPR
jgi:hypothetical protein